LETSTADTRLTVKLRDPPVLIADHWCKDSNAVLNQENISVTTPEEQADLDKLLAAQQLVRINNHNFMEHLMRMSPEDFKHAGFRNLEDGLIRSMTSATKKDQRSRAIYLKKWPDK